MIYMDLAYNMSRAGFPVRLLQNGTILIHAANARQRRSLSGLPRREAGIEIATLQVKGDLVYVRRLPDNPCLPSGSQTGQPQQVSHIQLTGSDRAERNLEKLLGNFPDVLIMSTETLQSNMATRLYFRLVREGRPVAVVFNEKGRYAHVEMTAYSNGANRFVVREFVSPNIAVIVYRNPRELENDTRQPGQQRKPSIAKAQIDGSVYVEQGQIIAARSGVEFRSGSSELTVFRHDLGRNAENLMALRSFEDFFPDMLIVSPEVIQSEGGAELVRRWMDDGRTILLGAGPNESLPVMKSMLERVQAGEPASRAYEAHQPSLY